jgi:acyl-coenzyme A thioesterase PaaI-like protein
MKQIKWKKTLGLWYFAWRKIPMIFFARPRVLELNQKRCEIVIPFRSRVKNHVRSMYFGALAVGADMAGGLMAMEAIARSGKKVNLLFKDMQGDFLRRVEGDAHFICEEGALIQEMMKATLESGERINQPIHIVVKSPKLTGDEILARFVLTLSLKAQK